MAGHTVTRAQLSDAVYQEVGLSRNESAEFVESVIAERQMAGFSRVFERPENLPTLEEIHDPARWIARIDGRVSTTP